MIATFLSVSEIGDDKLKEIVSKKLDVINDVQICFGRNGDIILIPLNFPKTILPVLYSLSISDYVLFYVSKEIKSLDAELAICVENSRIDNGYCIVDDYSDLTSFDNFFSKYKVGRFSKEKSIPSNISIASNGFDFDYVSIDKHFVVKGIGSVIIGFVIGKDIKKGDKLLLLPSLKQCTVKSIQIMDENKDSAITGSHVGLALNNVSESDISSNYALSSLSQVYKESYVNLKISPFYKEDIFSKTLSFSFFGEAITANLSKEGERIKAKFNKAIPIINIEYVLADPSLSIGKNRIAGSFIFC